MVARVDDPVVLAELARRDPSVWASLAGGFVQTPFHHRIQRFLTRHDDCLIGLARGHGKTTQVALRLAYEIGRDPNIRVKYVQQTDAEAIKTSKMIRSIIRSETFQFVFPGVEIQTGDDTLSAWTVTRARVGRDPTFEAKGIFGRAGGRYDLLAGDDVCDLRNAVQQAALRMQVKEAWANNWLPMADPTQARKPRTWKVGTPYHVSDIMADWRLFHEQDGSLLWLPVVNFRSPWAEGFDEAYMRERRERLGPVAYARAYELVPVASEQLIFDPGWIDLYDEIPATESSLPGGRMVATFDFAYSERKLKDDPDWSVCLVGWASATGNIWVTDLLRARLPFPEFRRQALRLCARAGVTEARAEANGPQKGIVALLNEEAPFPVIGLDRQLDKVTRATAQQPFVESGRLHLPGKKGPTGQTVVDPRFQPLWDEMTTFPASDHDDTVDAAVDMMAMARRTTGSTRVSRIETGTGRPARLYGGA